MTQPLPHQMQAMRCKSAPAPLQTATLLLPLASYAIRRQNLQTCGEVISWSQRALLEERRQMHMRAANSAAAIMMMTVAAVMTMTSPTLFWNLQMRASSRERGGSRPPRATLFFGSRFHVCGTCVSPPPNAALNPPPNRTAAAALQMTDFAVAALQ
jgi:hypothetical protein